MAYKNKDKQRETTKTRVKKFRENKALQDVTCPECSGRGFIELQAGLIMKPCPKCRGRVKEEIIETPEEQQSIIEAAEPIEQFQEGTVSAPPF